MASLSNDLPTDNRPVSSLVSEALQQLSRLFRSEVALARAELSEKAQQVARSGALVALGGLLAIPSIGILLIALAAWLMEAGLRGSLAYLIAAVAGLALAASLAWAGINRLKADNLIPKRTLNQLQRDAAAAKEHI
jgi:Putative Actinobacterial Holin-X, holin superfamily III